MSNEKLIEQLQILKSNFISYSFIAQNTGIPTSTFYYYLKNNRFPYSARKRIEDFINENYSEVLNDE